MPKDYASRKKCMKMGVSRGPKVRRCGKKSKSSPSASHRILWLTTFLLIFLFAGSLNYLHHHKGKFLRKFRAETPTTKVKSIKRAIPEIEAKENLAGKPKFDFYNILSKEKVNAAPPPSSEQYFLDIATVSSPKQADTTKARLALLGFDVTVKQIDTSKGLAYKVMVGPYTTKSAAKSDQKRLKQSHMSSRMEEIHLK